MIFHPDRPTGGPDFFNSPPFLRTTKKGFKRDSNGAPSFQLDYES